MDLQLSPTFWRGSKSGFWLIVAGPAAPLFSSKLVCKIRGTEVHHEGIRNAWTTDLINKYPYLSFKLLVCDAKDAEQLTDFLFPINDRESGQWINTCNQRSQKQCRLS